MPRSDPLRIYVVLFLVFIALFLTLRTENPPPPYNAGEAIERAHRGAYISGNYELSDTESLRIISIPDMGFPASEAYDRKCFVYLNFHFNTVTITCKE